MADRNVFTLRSFDGPAFQAFEAGEIHIFATPNNRGTDERNIGTPVLWRYFLAQIIEVNDTRCQIALRQELALPANAKIVLVETALAALPNNEQIDSRERLIPDSPHARRSVIDMLAMQAWLVEQHKRHEIVLAEYREQILPRARGGIG